MKKKLCYYHGDQPTYVETQVNTEDKYFDDYVCNLIEHNLGLIFFFTTPTTDVDI